MFVTSPPDAQVVQDCLDPPTYFPFTYHITVLIFNVSILSNMAGCPTCSGGGMVVGPGGDVSIRDAVITNNSAGLLGGGIFLGDVSLVPSTCRTTMTGGFALQCQGDGAAATAVALVTE